MKQKKKKVIDIQFITVCISTSLVLLLLGIVFFFVFSANSLSTYVRENLELSFLLKDNVSEKEAQKLVKELAGQPFAKECAYISKEQILKEQTQAMGLDPTEFLGYNPYTASIELKLNATYANADSLSILEKEWAKMPQISELSYQKELLSLVNENIRKISILLLFLAAVLSLISFALINNTIKLTIYSQRFLLHTMKLVGASWHFIRRPFMARNLWVGVIAGVLADGMLAGGLYLLTRYEPGMLQMLTAHSLLIIMGGVLLVGIVLTLFCANISLNRFLRMKAGDLYYI